MRLAILVIGCVLLCGCTHSLTTYKASIQSGDRTYNVSNRKGSLLIVEEADGTKITADDRGLAENPGLLDKIVDYSAIRAATAN